jgi:uncharacterized repeat protein (TIGR04138 family)
MAVKDFEQVMEVLLKEDSRYARGAYQFVRHALDFTIERTQKQSKEGRPRHINGVELLHGIRDYAIDQYGPMAHMLLEAWGVKAGEDFGHIVFNLVNYGVFTKTQDDSLEDFKNSLDFHEAFVRPYLPRFQRKAMPTSRRARKTRTQIKPSTDTPQAPEGEA